MTPGRVLVARRRSRHQLFPALSNLDEMQRAVVAAHCDLVLKMERIQDKTLLSALYKLLKSAMQTNDAYTQSEGPTRTALVQYLLDHISDMDKVVDAEIARQDALHE
jgi:hypothetical protein